MGKSEKQSKKKRCTKCGKLKDRGEFGKAKLHKDGLRYWCNFCEQQYQRAYYLRTRKVTRRNFKYEESHRVFGGVKQKRCRKCRRWKAEREFQRSSATKDKLRGWPVHQFLARQSGLSYEFAGKLPQKREILIVQVEFGKIISIARSELCFVRA